MPEILKYELTSEQEQVKQKLAKSLQRQQAKIDVSPHLSEEDKDMLADFSTTVSAILDGQCGDPYALSICTGANGTLLLQHIRKDVERAAVLMANYGDMAIKINKIDAMLSQQPPRTKIESYLDFALKVKGLIATTIICFTLLIIVFTVAPKGAQILGILSNTISSNLQVISNNQQQQLDRLLEIHNELPKKPATDIIP